MKTILAAIDFSPVTRRVLDQVVSLARVLPARVVVVNVTPPPPYVPEDYGFSVAADTISAVRDYALTELKGIERNLKQKKIDAKTFHTVGHPGTLVIECAKQFAADIIVLGSHGHTALYDFVIGSTAHVVLKRATCPVLVVPARPAAKTGRALRKAGAMPRATPAQR